jgi:hypothetical protein
MDDDIHTFKLESLKGRDTLKELRLGRLITLEQIFRIQDLNWIQLAPRDLSFSGSSEQSDGIFMTHESWKIDLGNYELLHLQEAPYSKGLIRVFGTGHVETGAPNLTETS